MTKNLTLAGNNSTIDGSKSELIPIIGDNRHLTTVILRDLVIRDCARVYDNANLVIEGCKFINSELDAHGCNVLVKNTIFERCVNGTDSGEGGAISLHKVTGVLDNCSFIGNSAFRNSSWCGGSGGGLYIDNSTITLIDPIIMDNIACTGGGICVSDSDLTIYGGRIEYNRAIPINYTEPVRYFGGEGGAIFSSNSKLSLFQTSIVQNPSRQGNSIWAIDGSDIRLMDSRIMP